MTYSPTHPIAQVVAVAANRVIGADGDLPWRLPGDLKHFKAVTLGKPIVMGRKTWESLPKRPLPGRPNIVVTRQAGYRAQGAEVFTDLDAALARADALAGESGLEEPEVSVIGGAEIFRLTLPLTDRLYLTEVHAAPEGDTWFPELDRRQWREAWRRPVGPEDDAPGHDFVLLVRC
ncbi:MAG: dihydrofolate reductase [Marivibrio sp.]|uniref:dihydrofolate reductase n=1 Tax=Marivibrio sp. TaxID=2039719 RepID=UPI0032EC6F3A